MIDMHVEFETFLAVLSPDLLKAHAEQVTGSAPVDIAEAITEGVCNPSSPPADCGYEIFGKEVVSSGGAYTLNIVCRVFDEAKVLAEARDCYQSCWGDEAWVPENINDALYEILVASNANDSPNDIGVNITGNVSVGVPAPFQAFTLEQLEYDDMQEDVAPKQQKPRMSL